MNEEPTVPQWVCVCCYVLLVNGDACDCCDRDELIQLFEGMNVTPGMIREEHWSRNECDGEDRECDCETNSFSWASCDGCGGNLGGARYAVTGWIPTTENV